VLTGGVDSMVSPFYLAGSSLLGALSKRNDDPTTASRPFDKDRDGFVLGEGAAMLMLEEEGHARARGARILAELAGAGVTESAYRITDLHPEGTGPIEAMQEALDVAGVEPEAVGYVNAHGTGTALNDRIEALAVSRVFPADRCAVVVGSTKSMTGHMISAAGAIELAFCAQAVATQTIPPNANLFTPDPECAVTLAGGAPEARSLECALSNSVGFGGSNTALLVRRTAP
jgi:3-oxoacyl-[acyl-carrier-protein] synthase II